jgi:predicted nucleotidyltransferase
MQEGHTMLSHEMILKQIEEHKKTIKRYGVKEIGLFGSYVRDEQQTKSDIDILVEFEKGKKTFDNYMSLKFFLEDLFNCKVDLVIAETIKPKLKSNILESVKYATGL